MMSLGFALARPFLRVLDPESAHRLTLDLLKRGFARGSSRDDPASLRVRAFGLDFPNPIGLAAGFDKNAEVPDAMLKLGFGFVEVGSITPKPQDGNPKPRIFRLAEDRGVINRLGFNNEGLDAARRRLEVRRMRPGIVGINVGANKDSTDRIADYVTAIRGLAPYATYITVNISSPNTPGLRGLQNRDELNELLQRVMEARMHATRNVPLLVKIAPDLDRDALFDIAGVALDRGVDGIIVSNTTVGERENLKSRYAEEAGGLSGRPLFRISTQRLAELFLITSGKLTLIGAGGVSSGADAYMKIRAGATLVQLYTALIYEGPGLVRRIKRDLARLVLADGYAHVAKAIGKDAERLARS